MDSTVNGEILHGENKEAVAVKNKISHEISNQDTTSPESKTCSSTIEDSVDLDLSTEFLTDLREKDPPACLETCKNDSEVKNVCNQSISNKIDLLNSEDSKENISFDGQSNPLTNDIFNQNLCSDNEATNVINSSQFVESINVINDEDNKSCNHNLTDITDSEITSSVINENSVKQDSNSSIEQVNLFDENPPMQIISNAPSDSKDYVYRESDGMNNAISPTITIENCNLKDNNVSNNIGINIDGINTDISISIVKENSDLKDNNASNNMGINIDGMNSDISMSIANENSDLKDNNTSNSIGINIDRINIDISLPIANESADLKDNNASNNKEINIDGMNTDISMSIVNENSVLKDNNADHKELDFSVEDSSAQEVMDSDISLPVASKCLNLQDNGASNKEISELSKKNLDLSITNAQQGIVTESDEMETDVSLCIASEDANCDDNNKSSKVSNLSENFIDRLHEHRDPQGTEPDSDCNNKNLEESINEEMLKDDPMDCSESQKALDFAASSKTCSSFEDQPIYLNSSGCSLMEKSVMDISDKSSIGPNPLIKLSEHLNSIGQDYYPKKDFGALNYSTHHMQTSEQCDSTSEVHSEENVDKDSSDSFVFTELSNEETGFPDTFTGLVKIGKYISVKGDFTLRSTEALVESPSLVAPYLLKEPDSFPPRESKVEPQRPEMKDFFRSAAGEILIGIGLSLVTEWFHKDMIRIKKRQIKRNGQTPQLEQELALHENRYTEATKANGIYSFKIQTCKSCGFITESSTVMEGHLLIPHMTPRKEFQCNFCKYVNKDPTSMLAHMKNQHRKIGRIQPPILFFECPFCPFENNSKVKLNNHLIKCQRYFDSGINQAPPRDYELPALTPKPITVAVVKAYEKSLGSMQQKRGRPRKSDSSFDQYSPTINNSLMNSASPYRSGDNIGIGSNQFLPGMQMQNINYRPPTISTLKSLQSSLSPMAMPPPNRFFPPLSSSSQMMPIHGSSHLVTTPSQFPFSSSLINTSSKKVNAPLAPNFNYLYENTLQNTSKGFSDVSLTPLPKLQGPYPVPTANTPTRSPGPTPTSNCLVVCEICDGYIKDLEQLRTHMQLIHKVKIHPKMLVSRPPLNCQKCQWRFFTDQGLERHLLGAHGLVTSNMQELSNKNKDAGCCTICGRVYACRLVSHMNLVHKISLKPAHLSYKCTVCSATFNLYRLFENHVYLVHSAKRSADDRSSPAKRHKSDKSDSHSDSANHKDRQLLKDNGENVQNCSECGANTVGDKCEKCLKMDSPVQDLQTSKSELISNDKAVEKVC